MPTLYHGTRRDFAEAMALGAIDVTRGEGELGRGFYTQDSIGSAFRRAIYAHGNRRAVLVLSVNDEAYSALRCKRLNLRDVKRLDAGLRSRKQQAAYSTRHDLIVGPLLGDPEVMQQKFQSLRAESLLNSSLTVRAVLP